MNSNEDVAEKRSSVDNKASATLKRKRIDDHNEHIVSISSIRDQKLELVTEDISLQDQELIRFTGLTTHISCLPNEILTKIFIHLPLDCRKNARSVCRRWFNASNLPQFWRTEKIIYRHYNKFDDIVRIIGKSSRKIWNLEFRWSRDIDNTFWMMFGSKIEWLSFKHYYPREAFVEYIAPYCNNLKYFSIAETSFYKDKFEFLCSSEGLDIDTPIIRDMSEFPMITEIFFSPEDEEIEVFSRKLIDNRMKFESLNLSETENLNRFSKRIWEVIHSLYFPKLKNITVMVDSSLSVVELEKYRTFFSRNGQQLQNVEIQILTMNDFTMNETGECTTCEQLIHCVFVSCVHIESLVISNVSTRSVTVGYVNLDTTLLTKMMMSKLKAISFDGFVLEMSAPQNIINYNLRKIFLNTELDGNTISLFCQSFYGLTHLEMYHISELDVQAILQYEENLECLQLYGLKDISDFAFTGCHSDMEDCDQYISGYPLQRLTKLQFLHLTFSKHVRITERTLKELKFLSNLSKLNLVIHMEENGTKMSGSLFLDICSHLKKLRFLKIEGHLIEPSNEQCIQLFECCPALRRLKLPHCNSKYVYNVENKKVEKVDNLYTNVYL